MRGKREQWSDVVKLTAIPSDLKLDGDDVEV